MSQDHTQSPTDSPDDPSPSESDREGNRSIDGAIERLYSDLHGLARRHLTRERRSHTLQPTALAHEAYVRLQEQQRVDWSDAADFLTAAAMAIRRILIDHARGKATAKRGGNWTRFDLGELSGDMNPDVDLIDLDAALSGLAHVSDRQARLVELRFFCGLSRDEAAEVLSISPRTADNEWRVARTWLAARLQRAI